MINFVKRFVFNMALFLGGVVVLMGTIATTYAIVMWLNFEGATPLVFLILVGIVGSGIIAWEQRNDGK